MPIRPQALLSVLAAALLAPACTTLPGPGAGLPPGEPPWQAQPGEPRPPAPPPPGRQDPRLAALAADPLICVGVPQCRDWWVRAQAWVSRHSMMAIVTSTDAVIETLAPNAPGKLGFKVVREPLEGNRSRIGIAVACHGGCPVEVRVNATNAFRRYVRGEA